jgi:hypothetical protein
MPLYLTGSVALLGFLAYLASFGPLFNINTNMGPFGGAELTASGMGYWTMAALIAALLAAVGLVAKGKNYTPVVAVAALLGLLLVIGQLLNRPDGISAGWALWLVLLLTLLQASFAILLCFPLGILLALGPAITGRYVVDRRLTPALGLRGRLGGFAGWPLAIADGLGPTRCPALGMVAAYAPQEDAAATERELFWDGLSDMLQLASDGGNALVLCGVDANGHLGSICPVDNLEADTRRLSEYPYIRPHQPEMENRNGTLVT